MMKLASACLNSDMGVVWGLLCLHPNTIKPSYYYYYYYYSSSSRCDFVRQNSRRPRIRSLLNFTGRWISISRVHSSLGIFKMIANIKIKKIVKNSKMKKFQWKWIFTGSKTCCTIWRQCSFAMAGILNPKWPPKYKNPPIWTKFGFQVDYDVAN